VNTSSTLLADLSNCLEQLQAAIKAFSQLVDKLGTTQDSKQLRQQLHQQREQTQRTVLDVKQLLLQPYDRNVDKAKHDKLASQFTQLGKEYERIVQISLKKEKEIVTELEKRQSGIGLPQKRPESELQEERISGKLQAVAAPSEDQFAEFLIEEQNREIQQLEKDLKDLQGCFVDIAQEIQKQQVNLDQIEVNVTTAEVQTKEGTTQMQKAYQYAKSARCKLFVILLIVVLVLAAIIATIVAVTSKK